MLCWYNVFVLELLNLFVGKELLYSHVCSWALPVSGVDRTLCLAILSYVEILLPVMNGVVGF